MQTFQNMVDEITNIRYGKIVGDKGNIDFDFRGRTISIREPPDVLLVGVDETKAKMWIVENCWFILAHIKYCHESERT